MTLDKHQILFTKLNRFITGLDTNQRATLKELLKGKVSEATKDLSKQYPQEINTFRQLQKVK